MMKEIKSAYIHFPFCVKKCPYCDFVSYAGCMDKQKPYIEALCREISLAGQTSDGISPAQESGLATIYMGGGTPSLFTPEQIADVLNQLRNTFGISENAEITMEVNPGTVDRAAFQGYRKAGVNRISIGIQSFKPSLLASIGRIHSAEQAQNAIDRAKEAGFTNISCDLMTGLAGQTLQDAQDSLAILFENRIPHISFYALTLEEGTPFFDKYLDHEELLPSAELEREMYHALIARLKQEGYIHYEISNCAKPGFESRHNMTYWRADPYYGFGCGASSYREGNRVGNTSDLDAYIAAMSKNPPDLTAITAECEEIDDAESRREFMLLGFRMIGGVSSEEFRARFGLPLEEVFGEELARLSDKNLIVKAAGQYKLSEKGLDYANEVFREFV